MTSFHVYSDPLTRASRFFHGFLYNCRENTPTSCPYAMVIENCYFCNHPHDGNFGCGKIKNSLEGL